MRPKEDLTAQAARFETQSDLCQGFWARLLLSD
jgi:hypothetical protein